MKHVIAAVLFVLFAGPVCAQAQLDLQVPPPKVEWNADAVPAADPPGKYYGDVDGNADEPSRTKVWGSVNMGIGHSNAFGTTQSMGADINMSRQLDNGRQLDLHINVDRSSGFPWGSPYDYGPLIYRGR